MTPPLHQAFFARWVDSQFMPFAADYKYEVGRHYGLQSFWKNAQGRTEANINHFMYRGESSRHVFENPHLIQFACPDALNDASIKSLAVTELIAVDEGSGSSSNDDDLEDSDKIEVEMSGGDGGESDTAPPPPPKVTIEETTTLPAPLEEPPSPAAPITEEPTSAPVPAATKPDSPTLSLRGGCGSRTTIIITKYRKPKPVEEKKAEEKAVVVAEKKEEKKEERKEDKPPCSCGCGTKVSYNYICQAPPVMYCAPVCPPPQQYVCYPAASCYTTTTCVQYSNGDVCYRSG